MVESPEQGRRAESRTVVYIRAVVILPYNEQLPAIIVDLSAGGCQIRLPQLLELPRRFDLQFHDLAYVCERRWAKDLSVGVQFLDLCPRARRRELSMK